MLLLLALRISLALLTYKIFNLLFYLLFLSPKALIAKGATGLISSMASTSLKGEGGLYLFFCGLDIARGRGRLISSVASHRSRARRTYLGGSMYLH